MSLKLLTENHLEFLSLKIRCIGSSEYTLVKMPHCWKSHVTVQLSHRNRCPSTCSTGLAKHIFEHKILHFFLPISFNICFGYSKESSHRDDSCE